MEHLVLTRVPDEYRGSLDCLSLPRDCRTELYEDNGGKGSLYSVYRGDVFLGWLEEWYGSDGNGKLAAHYFRKAENVMVTYSLPDEP